LAVKAAKIYLAGKHRRCVNWQVSEKYGEGVDIRGISDNGKIIAAAEVKTTSRSEKETLGSQQRSQIRSDIEKLLEIDAKHKYLFIIDDKNRKAIEGILKNTDRAVHISLVNIFEH
jgi:Holliday junction resolvase-like predicted endonuclease